MTQTGLSLALSRCIRDTFGAGLLCGARLGTGVGPGRRATLGSSRQATIGEVVEPRSLGGSLSPHPRTSLMYP